MSVDSRGERVGAGREDDRRLCEFAFPSAETLECPYAFYAAMRREAPVHQLPGRDVFFVSRWEDIVFVADHPELFSTRGAGEVGLVALPASAGSQSIRAAEPDMPGPVALSAAGLSRCDGAEHRLKRSVALKLVAPERLRRYTPFVTRTVNELIDAFIDRGEVELAAEFSAPLPLIVICEMLGVPRADDLFGALMRQPSTSASRFLSEDAKEERRAVGEQVYQFMRQLVCDRHEHPCDDFISEFIQEHVALAGTLALEYLVTEITTLLFGGLVTTQHMFTNTMFLLLTHPAEMERVLDDPSLIRPMLDESLRVESPFHLTETIATRDTELAGVPIPAGAAVYKVWGSGNRDEEKFDDPATLRIGRPGLARSHLGFGRGNHRCLGAPLALLEGTIGLEILLARCRNIRLDPSTNDWTHVPSIGFRSLQRLHLAFDPA